jgi:hypothetical protein
MILFGMPPPPPGGDAHPVEVAWWLLYIIFIVVPIVAGLDKFSNFLTDWTKYLSPLASRMLGGHDQQFMYLVGVIEIVVGICLIFWPTILAFVAAGWLLAIILNLLISGANYDIAFRDLGLMIAALALGFLSFL